MRIVQINTTYGNSDSTGRTTKEMHRWLREHGYDSNVFLTKISDGISENEKGIHFFSGETDKKVHAVLSRITGLQGYYSRNSTRSLIKKLRDIKPQIVILRVLHSNCINFPMLCRYLADSHTATILVLDDCWYFTGHCCHYSKVDCDGWRDACGKCSQIHEWNKSFFFDTSKKCLSDKRKWFSKMERLGVIGVSDWITNEAKQSVLKNAFILQRVYNWIDTDIFRPQKTDELRKKWRLQKGTHVLLGVATGWSDDKGLQEMLLAAEEFSTAKVILIGRVPKEIPLPENILQVGTIKDPRLLAKYYAMADVFLNPSVQETFGKTTAEAICCGTPVVAYETTACTELVGQKCGKLVSLKNVNLYIKAVQKILKEGKTKYLTDCIEFAEENFSREVNMQMYIDIIGKLIKNR